MSAYLSEQGHTPAAVVVNSSIVRAAVTYPKQRVISQIYDIQHNASDGEDRTSDVHEHSEAHLRDEIQSIKT